MSFLVLCFLCVVQGLTEFLPVSSSGHLVFVEQVFGIESNLMLLNLFLHLSSLLAVVMFYRKTIFELIKKPFQPLTYKLILSTFVSAIFAFAYKFSNINNCIFKIYGFCFLITAVVLFLCDRFQKHAIVLKKPEVNYKDAFIVGISQGLAVVPGISRSGSTIATLIFLKNNEQSASEYSFLMSIPIIIGGFLLELLEVKDYSKLFLNVNLWQYLFAFILTFLIAYIALKLTVKMLKNQKFVYFSAYLVLISIIVLIINFT